MTTHSSSRAVELYWTQRLDHQASPAAPVNTFATARLPYHNPTWGETLGTVAYLAACALCPPIFMVQMLRVLLTPWPKIAVPVAQPAAVPRGAAQPARAQRRLDPSTIDMARWQTDAPPRLSHSVARGNLR